MAKSARSKSKIRNRNVLRAAVFGPHEQARIQRLAEKQKAAAEADAKDKADDVAMDEGAATAAAASTAADNTSAKDAATGDVDMADSDSEKPQKSSRSKKRSGKIAKNQRIVKVRGSNGQLKKKRVLRWTKSTGFN
ncbi:hypothetical protein LPJ53_000841 [Coemansia erecta]|uniref:DUF2423 domain-containing protein n=1 Tax=Coemansia erecta TaxID=147472 RepID=A0A9W8CVI4_9FUNG|nr:hypothetical protein LPJ53_000841 [Coemansia erecta]